LNHPYIQVRLNAQIVEVSGQAGNYQLKIDQDEKIVELSFGAIVVATGAHPKGFPDDHWYDATRVKKLIEYNTELNATSEMGKGLDLQDVVMILYADGADGSHSAPLNCLSTIRQAILTKELNPAANVVILFRHLNFGSAFDHGTDELERAKELGVTFFRYQKDHPPVIGDGTVDVYDSLTGEAVLIAYDRVVVAMPFEPQENTNSLAALLRLPQDEDGFIIEPRLRLRPDRYVNNGIFVVGGAHQPVDTAEALFQAYVTGARARRFLQQETIDLEAPVAEIEANLCTGCGNCVQVCPMSAIKLEKRDGVLSLSEVNALSCIGCGNCVVVCPVKAIGLPGWNDAVILAQISAALRPLQSPITEDQQTILEPKVVALACEWSAYAAAELAGTRRLNYPHGLRIIRMNCSARFDPNLILWAFLNGADGVFLGACNPGECHYGTGNLFAKERSDLLKKQLAEHGFSPNRLRLEFLSGEDSDKFVKSVTEFIMTIETMDGQTT
jgi:heterodisulfide reductase subunit A